jgi:hypothetical protein
VSVLVVAQSSSEIPEGLTNNPVYKISKKTLLMLITELCCSLNPHFSKEIFICKFTLIPST